MKGLRLPADCSEARWTDLPSTTGRLWEVQCASRTLIVKRYLDLRRVQREVEALRLAVSLPVPRVVAVSGVEQSVAVAKVSGTRFSALLAAEGAHKPEQMILAEALGRLLQALHSIPGSASQALPAETVKTKLERELLRLQSLLAGGLGEVLELPVSSRRGRDIKGRILRTEGELGLAIMKLRRIASSAESGSDGLQLVLTHGDLWCGNILVPDAAPNAVMLLDFEHACFSSRIFDLATLFMRGLAPRSPREPYRITPLEGLWPSFVRGYGAEIGVMGDSKEFLCARAGYLLRTLNHYAEQLIAYPNDQEGPGARQTCLRIGGAILGLCDHL